jgi:hypothetical protein
MRDRSLLLILLVAALAVGFGGCEARVWSGDGEAAAEERAPELGNGWEVTEDTQRVNAPGVTGR